MVLTVKNGFVMDEMNCGLLQGVSAGSKGRESYSVISKHLSLCYLVQWGCHEAGDATMSPPCVLCQGWGGEKTLDFQLSALTIGEACLMFFFIASHERALLQAGLAFLKNAAAGGRLVLTGTCLSAIFLKSLFLLGLRFKPRLHSFMDLWV